MLAGLPRLGTSLEFPQAAHTVTASSVLDVQDWRQCVCLIETVRRAIRVNVHARSRTSLALHSLLWPLRPRQPKYLPVSPPLHLSPRLATAANPQCYNSRHNFTLTGWWLDANNTPAAHTINNEPGVYKLPTHTHGAQQWALTNSQPLLLPSTPALLALWAAAVCCCCCDVVGTCWIATCCCCC